MGLKVSDALLVLLHLIAAAGRHCAQGRARPRCQCGRDALAAGRRGFKFLLQPLDLSLEVGDLLLVRFGVFRLVHHASHCADSGAHQARLIHPRRGLRSARQLLLEVSHLGFQVGNLPLVRLDILRLTDLGADGCACRNGGRGCLASGRRIEFLLQPLDLGFEFGDLPLVGLDILRRVHCAGHRARARRGRRWRHARLLFGLGLKVGDALLVLLRALRAACHHRAGGSHSHELLHLSLEVCRFQATGLHIAMAAIQLSLEVLNL